MTKRGTLWIPVDTDFLDPVGNRHGLDDPAVLAYLRLIAWSKRQRTDGYVPRAVAAQLLNGTRDLLIASGLVTEDEDEVEIVDYLKWNPSRDSELARQERDRRRKQKARDLALSSKEKDKDTHTDRDRDSGVTQPGIRADSTRIRPLGDSLGSLIDDLENQGRA